MSHESVAMFGESSRSMAAPETLGLRSVIEPGALLAPEIAVHYSLQVCEALACAHTSNFFALGDKPVKPVDFSISKFAFDLVQGRADTATFMQVAAEVPRYAAPERLRTGFQPDARSDIWPLGCVLYELLTGHSAFELIQTRAALLEQDPVGLESLREGLPDAQCAAVVRCLRKSPEARSPTWPSSQPRCSRSELGATLTTQSAVAHVSALKAPAPPTPAARRSPRQEPSSPDSQEPTKPEH